VPLPLFAGVHISALGPEVVAWCKVWCIGPTLGAEVTKVPWWPDILGWIGRRPSLGTALCPSDAGWYDGPSSTDEYWC
jgi:hypothetical protein